MLGVFPPKLWRNTLLTGIMHRSMAMDTRVYHDPEMFKPERFLPGPHGGPEQFPHASFGFGRR